MAEFDTLIRDGTVIDGTGAPRQVADLGIVGGKIAEIGRIQPHRARRVIDAHGLVVAPGAIDLHTHYDAQIHWDPYCTIASWHGVTSVTVGNCGFGLAPVLPADIDRAMLTLSRNEAIPLRSMQAALPFTWETFGQWMDHLDTLPLGINLSHLAPVSPIAAYALGGFERAKDRTPSERDTANITALLREALDAGAVGWGAQRQSPDGAMSFQRDFDGSSMVSDLLPDETYLALARELRGRPDCFIQFAQTTVTPADFLIALERDFDFNVRLAEASGRPVLYNAIAAIETGPEFFRTQLDWIARANARGSAVFAQAATVRAPLVFTLEDWNLFDASKAWRQATLGAPEERKAKLADPSIRRTLRAEVDSGSPSTSFFGALEAYKLNQTTLPDAKHLEGRTLREIAHLQQKHIIDVMLDLSLAEDLKTEWITPRINGDATRTRTLLESPYAVPGTSDGGAHVKFFAAGIYPTDLITWLVRDTGKLSLEEAHYRLSALPARIAQFRDRGTLEHGKAADIVVYDLERLGIGPIEKSYDLPAGEWRRICRAEGYRHVIVNGEPIFTDGACTGSTPGRLLRHGRSSA